jgi:hypothetical protein
MKRFLATALASFAIATAASAQAPVQRDTAAALMRALPITVDGAVHTARPRESILVQQAAVMEVVRLVAAAPASYAVSGVQAEMSLPAGAELFRVALESNATLRVFCAQDTVRTDVAGRPPRVGRTCLSDDDNDGDFDRFWYMWVPASGGGDGAGGWTLNPYPRIAGGLVYGVQEPFAASVPYATAESHGIAPVTLEIEHISYSATSSAYQLRSREGDALAEIGTEAFGARRVNSESDYPKLLTLMGAEIEILSRNEDRSITYRVGRGFSDTEPLRLVNVPPPAPPPPPAAPQPRRNRQ